MQIKKNTNSDFSKGLNIGFMVFFISFALIIIISKSQRDYAAVKYEEEIPPTYLTGDEDFASSRRGGIAYAAYRCFPISSSLVENNGNYKPIIENAIIQKRPAIFDLDFPYTVSKKKNSDTLIVEKDGYILKFLITEW